ncbi:hypothetical protein Hdeb2414_s0013g00403761 [Helianthus debilis subsp. tardiflorus]
MVMVTTEKQNHRRRHRQSHGSGGDENRRWGCYCSNSGSLVQVSAFQQGSSSVSGRISGSGSAAVRMLVQFKCGFSLCFDAVWFESVSDVGLMWFGFGQT